MDAAPMRPLLLFVVSTLLLTGGAIALAVLEAVWIGLGLIALGLALELAALPSLLRWLRSNRPAK